MEPSWVLLGTGWWGRVFDVRRGMAGVGKKGLYDVVCVWGSQGKCRCRHVDIIDTWYTLIHVLYVQYVHRCISLYFYQFKMNETVLWRQCVMWSPLLCDSMLSICWRLWSCRCWRSQQPLQRIQSIRVTVGKPISADKDLQGETTPVM